jgi:hypothetical protein
MMQVMGMGISYSTGALLADSVDEQELAEHLIESIKRNAKEVDSLARSSATASTIRVVTSKRSTNYSDPREAGWTYLLNDKDPQRDDIVCAIGRLAKHRGMKDPEDPLSFGGETLFEWDSWLLNKYKSPEEPDKQPPHYILIVGGPDQVPFEFQSHLDIAASVGRLAFDSVGDLKTYVEKVVRLEEAAEKHDSAAVEWKAVFFATDHGFDIPRTCEYPDPTVFSRRYLAQPLAEKVKKLGFEVDTIEGDQATKEQLLASLRRASPAIVFTASHGLWVESIEDLKLQKQLNGAIVCQHTGGEPKLDRTRLFSADDVSFDEPFLEGTVFFQFACFGYGTPAESDFAHWGGGRRQNAQVDFVAALPKKLLAHPRGPLAFIGHLDVAKLRGYTELTHPDAEPHWTARREPFDAAIDELLKHYRTAGQAMAEMNMRYGEVNATIARIWDLIERKKLPDTTNFRKELVDSYILRNDSKNYMVFGDPAVRPLLP